MSIDESFARVFAQLESCGIHNMTELEEAIRRIKAPTESKASETCPKCDKPKLSSKWSDYEGGLKTYMIPHFCYCGENESKAEGGTEEITGIASHMIGLEPTTADSYGGIPRSAEPPQPFVQPGNCAKPGCGLHRYDEVHTGITPATPADHVFVEPSVQGEQDWVEKTAKRIDREFIDDAWKWKEIATIIRIFAPTAPSITSERIEQLVIDLARETYDGFVMGGFEPQDAHSAIRRMLREAGVRVG